MAKKINYAAMFTRRSDGRYQGYWRELDAEGNPTGKRHAICNRDPEKLYRAIKEKETPTAITFKMAADAWRAARWGKFKAGTQVSYSPAYNRAVDEFGDRAANEIEPYEIQAMLERLKNQGLGIKTVKTQRQVVRQIYQFAILNKDLGRTIRTNPAREAHLPANLPPQKKREAPEDDIVDKVRKNAATAYFGLFPLFVMSTGFRRGEALAIRWCDIDFKNKRVHLSQQINYEGGKEERTDPKTDAGVRDVPILPDLYSLLKDAKPADAKETDYVFYSTDPQKWLPQSTYRRRWHHYCMEMGFYTDEPEIKVSKQGKRYIKHHYKHTLTAHVFRHGYATILFEADVDVYTAQHLLGHADVETTMAIYTHLRQKKKEKSLDKLDAYVAEQIANAQ